MYIHKIYLIDYTVYVFYILIYFCNYLVLRVVFYFILLKNFFFISWRLTTLQYCSGFCHTLT